MNLAEAFAGLEGIESATVEEDSGVGGLLGGNTVPWAVHLVPEEGGPFYMVLAEDMAENDAPEVVAKHYSSAVAQRVRM